LRSSHSAAGAVQQHRPELFQADAYSVLDLSLGKVTKVAEEQSLELRIEMQNALTQLHYDQPASNRINHSLFGVADPGTVESVGLSPGSSPRRVQLSAKYAF
jgi:hypothetical protein